MRAAEGTTEMKLRFAVLALALIWCCCTALHVWAQTPELLLFGGRNHRVFLGCLNCGGLNSDSVCNRFGDYGSRFSDKSIWNRFSDHGSRFSDYSPWNRFASDPPVIVDADGAFYGYLTSNRFHPIDLCII